MITRREAERLCKSFLGDNAPPKLPENFAFEVRKQPHIEYSSKGEFVAKTRVSRAKTLKMTSRKGKQCIICIGIS